MTRRGLLALGALILAAVWLGPLPELAGHRFSAHMAMHMAVVAVAAPLLAAGLAGGSLDPSRRFPALFSAIPASVLELIVVWAWHAPALHHAARHGTPPFVLEQATFLGVGVWLWLSAFGGPAAERGGRIWTGVAALLFTSMHMTLLGALFAITPRPLYAHGGWSGPTPLADQHLGGAIMLIVGGASYLAGGLWLAVEGLRRGAVRPERGAS